MNKLMFAVPLLFSASAFAGGATCTWRGGGTGWSDPANWDVVPGAGDSVVVPAGKTATAVNADMAVVKELAGIQLADATSGITFSGLTDAHALAVPVTGAGTFMVESGTIGKHLTLKADNTAFTGPFIITNAQVKVGSPLALGVSNPVKVFGTAKGSASSANCSLYYTCDGVFGNDIQVRGTYAMMVTAAVTNTGPMVVTGYCGMFVSGSGSFTQTGSFDSTVASFPAYLSGAFHFPGPGLLCPNSAQAQSCPVHFYGTSATALLADIGTTFAAGYGKSLSAGIGIVRFEGENLVGDLHGLRFGGEFLGAKACYCTYDLNGFDQACSNLLVYTSDYTAANAKKAVLKSERPATLTVKGTATGGSGDPLYCRLQGAVSLVLDSSTATPGTIRLGSDANTTTGGLTARRGTIRLEEGSSFSFLRKLAATDTGVIEVNTARLGNLVDLDLSGDGVLKLETDVAVRTVRVNGQFVEANQYASGDEVFGNHLQGSGTLRVLASSADSNPRHPEGTLAFYPFDDVGSGESLVSAYVRNDASDAYHGRVTTEDAASVLSDGDDTPGAYVFAGKQAGEPFVYANPRSVKFSGVVGTIAFDALSTAMSSNDDYTVEYFFKQDESATGKWGSMLKYDVGTFYYDPKDTAYPEGTLASMVVLPSAYPNIWYVATSASATYRRMPLSWANGGPADGYWHHVALVYSKSDRMLRFYWDYSFASSLDAVTNNVRETAEALVLGCSGAGTYKGRVSCLRVSSKRLVPDDFLRVCASSNGVSETVFHLSLDGTAGTMPETFPSRVNYSSADYPGQYWARNLRVYGTPVTWTRADESVVSPVCDSAVPRRSWPHLNSGSDFLAIDEGSVSVECKRHTTEQWCVGGCGVSVLPKDYDQVRSGSFTLEGFFKFDFGGWKSRIVDAGTSAGCQRLTFFGLSNPSYNDEYVLMAFYSAAKGTFSLSLTTTAPNITPVDGSVRTWSGEADFLKDGRWHHYAIVYDDAAMSFTVYYDRQEVIAFSCTKPYTPAVDSSNATYMIGHGLNNCGFMGLVDEVRLSRRALVPEEFLNFDNNGNGPGLLLLFR